MEAAPGEATDSGEEGWRGEEVGVAAGTAVALLLLLLLPSTTGASSSPPAVLFAGDRPAELPAVGLAVFADGAGLTALLLLFPAALPGTDSMLAVPVLLLLLVAVVLGADSVLAVPVVVLLETACGGGLRAEAFCPEVAVPGTKPIAALVLALAAGVLAPGLGMGLFDTGLGEGVGLAGPTLGLLEPGLGPFEIGLRLELLETGLIWPDGLAKGVAVADTGERSPAAAPAGT